MHRCLIRDERMAENSVVLLDHDEARHLRTVLRVKPGEPVELFNGRGLTRPAAVRRIGREGIELEAVGPGRQHPAPSCRLTLLACISKGSRMDWTVEKAVELGVMRIVPVISDRTIVRLGEGDADVKSARWLRVAVEAARQCGSVWLPQIDPPCSLAAAAANISLMSPVFVGALSPQARPLWAEMERLGEGQPDQAGWFVGPEGDFSPAELALLISSGARPVSLGRNVLRTDTAAIYGLCVLNCAWLR